jgi:hypothetical protein
MTETPGRYDIGKPERVKTAKEEVRKAIASLKAKGIKDWEILDAWSELAHQQGDYAVADTLESAAYELGKPVE